MTSINDTDPATRLPDLADRARILAPRLFALHGLSDGDGREILGWGMDFDDREEAVLYLPADSVTHHTVSAEHAALRYSALGDVQVTWLDQP